MTTAIRRRRGTTTQHTTFTGLEGEVTVDTTKDTLVVHDGSTAGGHPLAKAADTVNLTGAQTVAGVKTLSSNPVLDAGTANGVAYLNGSKVLTTGSALTFDGDSFSVGGMGFFGRLNVQRNSSAPQATLTLGDNGTPANDVGIYFRQISGVSGFSTAGAAFAWYNTSPGIGEQMRLTSTGLGIGTSSPTQRLDVVSSISTVARVASTSNGFRATGIYTAPTANAVTTSLQLGTYPDAGDLQQIISSGQLSIRSGTGQPLVFVTDLSSERMRIDSSGNLIQTVNTTAATLTTNQTLTFSIVNNSLLRISVRGSDGTTRTATLALA